MIKLCGPKVQVQPSPDDIVINTTSRSKDFGRGLSPFFVGPVVLWNGEIAQNVENAWQFSKVYPEHVGEDDLPSMEWWNWFKEGIQDTHAHRYPAGKGRKPLYSWWDSKPLSYIDARKQIYLPLYAKAVIKTYTYKKLEHALKQSEQRGVDLWLWDFDVYDYRALGMSLQDVLHDETQSMGHGFVLLMLLTQWCSVIGKGEQQTLVYKEVGES